VVLDLPLPEMSILNFPTYQQVASEICTVVKSLFGFWVNIQIKYLLHGFIIHTTKRKSKKKKVFQNPGLVDHLSV